MPVGNSGVNICNHAVTIRTLTHVFGRSLVVSLKMQNLKGFRQSIWLKTDWKLRKKVMLGPF
jgi:hypothetical protein